jgi:hypothetical protein
MHPPEAKTYTVTNFTHLGSVFGLIGHAIAAEDERNKVDQLTAALKRENLSVSDALATGLIAKLSEAGFQARAENGPWEEKDGRYTLAFDRIRSEADAVAVVSPRTVGFVTSGPADDYLPTVIVVVTVVDKERRTIYRGFHAAGMQTVGEQWKHTPATTTFRNFGALMANPGNTARALTAAAGAVSTSIAEDLRR